SRSPYRRVHRLTVHLSPSCALNQSPGCSFRPGCVSTTPLTTTAPDRTTCLACPPDCASPATLSAWARVMCSSLNVSLGMVLLQWARGASDQWRISASCLYRAWRAAWTPEKSSWFSLEGEKRLFIRRGG